MPKRNYPNHNPVDFSVPGPLCGRADRRGGVARPAAQPVEAVRNTESAAVPEEPQMCRYPHRIPLPASGTENEMVCLLRQQNGLLCELLGAVNSLVAVRLSERGGAD